MHTTKVYSFLTPYLFSAWTVAAAYRGGGWGVGELNPPLPEIPKALQN